MKTLLFLCLCLTASAQNVAVWFYGTNSVGVMTNHPITAAPIGTNTVAPGADAVMSIEAFRALKALTAPSWMRYQSNEEWQAQQPILQRKATFDSVAERIDAWQHFLGTPQNAGSNFVNIAQASQWAREMVWLQKRLIQIARPLYKPEEDQ